MVKTLAITIQSQLFGAIKPIKFNTNNVLLFSFLFFFYIEITQILKKTRKY